jgi:hypothetical protein
LSNDWFCLMEKSRSRGRSSGSRSNENRAFLANWRHPP